MNDVQANGGIDDMDVVYEDVKQNAEGILLNGLGATPRDRRHCQIRRKSKMHLNNEIFSMNISFQNLKKIAALFYNHPRYGIGDRVVEEIFLKYPNNEKLENILTKVTVLNSIYATAVYDIYGMSKHIYSITNLDYLLKVGDQEAVHRIRRGHNIINIKNGKERDFYSFSTKYCFFHNNNAFPIFDSVLAELLFLYNTKYNFFKGFSKKSLHDYSMYKKFIISFKNHFKLNELSCREFDHAMWLVGKYIFRKASDKDFEWLDTQIKSVL